MFYTIIEDPISQKKFSIYSNKGLDILKKYLMYGGASLDRCFHNEDETVIIKEEEYETSLAKRLGIHQILEISMPDKASCDVKVMNYKYDFKFNEIINDCNNKKKVDGKTVAGSLKISNINIKHYIYIEYLLRKLSKIETKGYGKKILNKSLKYIESIYNISNMDMLVMITVVPDTYFYKKKNISKELAFENLKKYYISLGFKLVYCSEDGKSDTLFGSLKQIIQLTNE